MKTKNDNDSSSTSMHRYQLLQTNPCRTIQENIDSFQIRKKLTFKNSYVINVILFLRLLGVVFELTLKPFKKTY